MSAFVCKYVRDVALTSLILISHFLYDQIQSNHACLVPIWGKCRNAHSFKKCEQFPDSLI